MNPIPLTFLSQGDIIKTGLTLKETIAIIEEVLRQHSLKNIENPPKPGVHPLPDAFIHAMPAYFSQTKATGMKWISVFSSNPEKGLPAATGVIVLNDADTGFPIAIMDAAYITALRTAAVSAIAVKHLADKQARTLGIVGTGIQGRYNLLFINEVLPGLKTVKIADRNKDILDAFKKDYGATFPFAIEICTSAEQAIQGADIVVTATGVLDKPIFKQSWIKPGALVLPVHSKGWEQGLLHSADKFIVDDWQQFNTNMGLPGGYYHPLPLLYAELGDIVLGKKPGRESASELIVNFNYGMAIHDIAMAAGVLKKAAGRGIGQKLTLAEGALPTMLA